MRQRTDFQSQSLHLSSFAWSYLGGCVRAAWRPCSQEGCWQWCYSRINWVPHAHKNWTGGVWSGGPLESPVECLRSGTACQRSNRTRPSAGPPQCPSHLSPLVWAFLAGQTINEQEAQICTGVSCSQTVPDGDKTGCTRPVRQSAKIQSATSMSNPHVIVLKDSGEFTATFMSILYNVP